MEESAEEKEGQVKGVAVAPGAAPLAFGGGRGHLLGEAEAVGEDLFGARFSPGKAALAHGARMYTVDEVCKASPKKLDGYLVFVLEMVGRVKSYV